MGKRLLTPLASSNSRSRTQGALAVSVTAKEWTGSTGVVLPYVKWFPLGRTFNEFRQKGALISPKIALMYSGQISELSWTGSIRKSVALYTTGIFTILLSEA